MTEKIITLIRPPNVLGSHEIINTVSPHTSLPYLGANLVKAGYKVIIIDSVAEALDQISPAHRNGLVVHGLNIDDITSRINPASSLIGVQMMFSRNYVYTKKLICQIKKCLPSSIIITGGEHATAIPDFILKDVPGIDIICLGESEETIVELCHEYYNDKNFQNVKGIVYRTDIKLVHTAPRKRISEPDSLPWPAWELLPLENYLSRNLGGGINQGRQIPMVATRGCPYNCTFCSNRIMWGATYCTRLPEKIIEEIKHYIKKYQIRAIEFQDLTMSTDRIWFVDFLKKMIEAKLDVEWSLPDGTRSELLDDEVLTLMQLAGCRYMCLVPESGSERTLRHINKKVSLINFGRIIHKSNLLGIKIKLNIMVGFPFETRKDYWKTFIFLMKCAFLGAKDATLNIYSPYPGTAVFNDLLESGEFELSDKYFDRLSVAWDIFAKENISYCRNVSSTETKFFLITSVICFYSLTYLLDPKGILHSLRYIFCFSKGQESTIFEERLREYYCRMRRKKIGNT